MYVDTFCAEAVGQVTTENWRDAVQNVIKTENEYWWKDGILSTSGKVARVDH